MSLRTPSLRRTTTKGRSRRTSPLHTDTSVSEIFDLRGGRVYIYIYVEGDEGGRETVHETRVSMGERGKKRKKGRVRECERERERERERGGDRDMYLRQGICEFN